MFSTSASETRKDLKNVHIQILSFVSSSVVYLPAVLKLRLREWLFCNSNAIFVFLVDDVMLSFSLLDSHNPSYLDSHSCFRDYY